jgi:hypothetical protein
VKTTFKTFKLFKCPTCFLPRDAGRMKERVGTIGTLERLEPVNFRKAETHVRRRRISLRLRLGSLRKVCSSLIASAGMPWNSWINELS